MENLDSRSWAVVYNLTLITMYDMMCVGRFFLSHNIRLLTILVSHHDVHHLLNSYQFIRLLVYAFYDFCLLKKKLEMKGALSLKSVHICQIITDSPKNQSRKIPLSEMHEISV